MRLQVAQTLRKAKGNAPQTALEGPHQVESEVNDRCSELATDSDALGNVFKALVSARLTHLARCSYLYLQHSTSF